MEGKLFNAFFLGLTLFQSSYGIPDCIAETGGFNLWCPHRLEGNCLGNETQSPYELVCDGVTDCGFSEVDEEGLFNPGLLCKSVYS